MGRQLKQHQTYPHPSSPPMSLLLSLLLSLVLLITTTTTTTHAIPLQFTIPQHGQECLYELLDDGEFVTVSVFLLTGAALKASIQLQGPVAPKEVQSGMDLQLNMERYHRGERIGVNAPINYEAMVDFESMDGSSNSHNNVLLPHDEEDEEEPLVMHVMEDDADMNIPANETEDQRQKREEKRRQRREEYHQRILQARQKREERLQKRMQEHMKIQMQQQQQHRVTPMEEGHPFQYTTQVKQGGWYQFCIKGTWYQVTAEMEMRKSSELGGVDNTSGHVYTYDEKALRDEELYLSLDTRKDEANAANGIQEEDFEETRTKLQKLRRLLAEIQELQQAESHRLALHAATNEHSHSRMVLNSLLETVLFMAVTGFQVYTIRKWFSAAPVLGR